MDRPAGVIRFAPPPSPVDALNAWSANIARLLDTVEKTCQQIQASCCDPWSSRVLEKAVSAEAECPAVWRHDADAHLSPVPAPFVQKESMVHKIPIGVQ